MNYTVELLPAANRQLDDLPWHVSIRVLNALAALADNPRPPGAIKLKGGHNLWRIRVGKYRVIYEIHDDELIVLVDSSKFRQRSSLILCGLSRIATVITDDGIEDHEARMLETAGVTLIVAKSPARSNEESSLQA